MRRRFYIPQAVIHDIQIQMSRGVRNVLRDWDLSVANEDAFTGYLGAMLRTQSRPVRVVADEVPGVWKWSLRYRKLSSLGPRTSENIIGADGLFELEILQKGQIDKKSILFQSKFQGSNRRDLIEQCAKLTTWREAAFIVEYSPKSIQAVTIDDALVARGNLAEAKSVDLDDFLANSFVACLVGDNDLRYYPHAEKLVWRNLENKLVSAKCPAKHRFQVYIRPPTRRDRYPTYAEELSGAAIYKNRMEASAEEILSIESTASEKKKLSAMREKIQINHPDKYQSLSREILDIFNMRTQEINHAYSEVKRK